MRLVPAWAQTHNPCMRAHLTSRWLLLLALLLALGIALAALLMATDTALSLWQRLRELSPWVARGYLLILGLLALLSLWFGWRLLRRPKSSKAQRQRRPQREQLEQATNQLEAAGVDTAAVRSELQLLDQRRSQPDLFIALFGEISSGKSSLINALLPGAQQGTSVLGGTTRQTHYFNWSPALANSASDSASSAMDLPLRLVDLPGFGEGDGESLATAARDEAARAHIVIYVCDGDLTRSQLQQLTQLIALGKPLIVALNKADRYQAAELAQIRQRLQQYLSPDEASDTPRWTLVTVQAGGSEAVRVIDAHGDEQWQQRQRPARLDELIRAIHMMAHEAPEELRQQQQESALMLAAERLEQSTYQHRQQQAEELVQRYARRAVAGALAAVAPGADLIIQGALATALVRALCQLYQVPIRDVDIDRFVSQANGRLKRNTAVVLAVAGNALKAFPGLGTVAGGLVHALAYGMIFHSLGRALSAVLAASSRSDNTQTPALPWQSAAGMAQFEEQWLGHLETPAKYLVRAALEQFQAERPGNTSAADQQRRCH